MAQRAVAPDQRGQHRSLKKNFFSAKYHRDQWSPVVTSGDNAVELPQPPVIFLITLLQNTALVTFVCHFIFKFLSLVMMKMVLSHTSLCLGFTPDSVLRVSQWGSGGQIGCWGLKFSWHTYIASALHAVLLSPSLPLSVHATYVHIILLNVHTQISPYNQA